MTEAVCFFNARTINGGAPAMMIEKIDIQIEIVSQMWGCEYIFLIKSDFLPVTLIPQEAIQYVIFVSKVHTFM